MQDRRLVLVHEHMFAQSDGGLGSARADRARIASRSPPTRRRGDRGRRGDREGPRASRAGRRVAGPRARRARVPRARVQQVLHRHGWLDARGECDGCLRAAALRAAFRIRARAGSTSARRRPSRRSPSSAARASGSHRLAHPLESRRRSLVEAWMSRVEPDDTGPIAPEEGYEIEVAEARRARGGGRLRRDRSFPDRSVALRRRRAGSTAPRATSRPVTCSCLRSSPRRCRPSSSSRPGVTFEPPSPR